MNIATAVGHLRRSGGVTQLSVVLGAGVAVVATVVQLLGPDISAGWWGVLAMSVGASCIWLLLEIHEASVGPEATYEYLPTREAAYQRVLAELALARNDSRVEFVSIVDDDLALNARAHDLTAALARAAGRGAVVAIYYVISGGASQQRLDNVVNRVDLLRQFPTSEVRVGYADGSAVSFAPVVVGRTAVIGLYGGSASNRVTAALAFTGLAAGSSQGLIAPFKATAQMTVLANGGVNSRLGSDTAAARYLRDKLEAL